MAENDATTPRSDDCARDWVVKRPTDNLAASLLQLDLNGHRATTAHKSAFRNTVEDNMRRNRNEKQKPFLIKKKKDQSLTKVTFS